jgi:hypothetical protein
VLLFAARMADQEKCCHFLLDNTTCFIDGQKRHKGLLLVLFVFFALNSSPKAKLLKHYCLGLKSIVKFLAVLL